MTAWRRRSWSTSRSTASRPRRRSVANRNGFFYVIDRTDGQFIYAIPPVEGINWTTGLDPKTGRPTINEAMKPKRRPDGGADRSRSRGRHQLVPAGLRTRRPGSSSSPTTSGAWGSPPGRRASSQYKPGDVYQGVDYQMYRHGRHDRAPEGDRRREQEGGSGTCRARCRCSPACSRPRAACVFTGDQRGLLRWPIDAKTGKQLWTFQTGSGINASPITYELDGKQYVAILSGLGGDPSFYIRRRRAGCCGCSRSTARSRTGPRYNAEVIEKALPVVQAVSSRGAGSRRARGRRLVARLGGAGAGGRGADQSVPRSAGRRSSRGARLYRSTASSATAGQAAVDRTCSRPS